MTDEVVKMAVAQPMGSMANVKQILAKDLMNVFREQEWMNWLTWNQCDVHKYIRWLNMKVETDGNIPVQLVQN